MGLSQSTLTTTLGSYAKTSDLATLQTQITDQINTSLGPYAKSVDVNALVAKITMNTAAALMPYARTADLSPYAKSVDVTALSTKVAGDIQTAIGPLAKSIDVTNLSAKLVDSIAAAVAPLVKTVDFNAVMAAKDKDLINTYQTKAAFNTAYDSISARFNDYTRTTDLKSLGMSYADGKLVSGTFGKAGVQSVGPTKALYYPMQEVGTTAANAALIFSAPDAPADVSGNAARIALLTGGRVAVTGSQGTRFEGGGPVTLTGPLIAPSATLIGPLNGTSATLTGPLKGASAAFDDVAVKRGQRVWLSNQGDLAHGIAHADAFPNKGLVDGPIMFGWDGGQVGWHHNDGVPHTAMRWNTGDIWTQQRFAVKNADESNALWFTPKWENRAGMTNNSGSVSEISNDTADFKSLMIVGNRSGGGDVRRVQIYDKLLLPNGGQGLKVGSWNMFENGDGHLVFAKDGANDGDNQPYVKITQDGNIWLSRSSSRGYVADNMVSKTKSYQMNSGESAGRCLDINNNNGTAWNQPCDWRNRNLRFRFQETPYGTGDYGNH